MYPPQGLLIFERDGKTLEFVVEGDVFSKIVEYEMVQYKDVSFQHREINEHTAEATYSLSDPDGMQKAFAEAGCLIVLDVTELVGT